MLGSSVSSELTKNAELFPLSKNYELYLKPLARVSLTVQIPTLHDASGQTKSFTTWGIIEKLRQLCPGVLSPPTPIKVVRTTLEFVRFIAELETKAEVKRVVTSLDSQFIKLSGFPQNLRVRASEAQPDCPRRHDWESFFRDAADMDETQPGERPDTIILTGLPVRWFVNAAPESSGETDSNFHSSAQYTKPDQPCPNVVRQVFETFGPIRNVDIPMLDPAQNPNCVAEFMNEVCRVKRKKHGTSTASNIVAAPDLDSSTALASTSKNGEVGGFGKIGPDTISIMGKPTEGLLIKTTSALGPIDSSDVGSNSRNPSIGSLTFVAYVQYEDYTGFTRAMEALRGQKLVYAPANWKRNALDTANNKLYYSAEIRVDFDRSKHLSRSAIQSRQIERNRLITLAQRRLAEAEAEAEQEAKQQRMLENAKRKEEERRRMEALAHQAEREARRAARVERRRQKAIERCKREKENLIKQKILLDERRRILAVRKLEAIRLVTFLVTRIQSRHDAIVAAKREARLARVEREAAEAEARLAKQKAIVITAASRPFQLAGQGISPSSNTESDRSISESNDGEELRQRLLAKLLERREAALRAILLKKRTELMMHQNSSRRSPDDTPSSTVLRRKRTPAHLRVYSRETGRT